jgi:hypothetical protein
MKSLAQLSEFYMTDKRPSEHNYTQFYETYFSMSLTLPITLLEIGVLEHPDKLIGHMAQHRSECGQIIFTFHRYMESIFVT